MAGPRVGPDPVAVAPVFLFGKKANTCTIPREDGRGGDREVDSSIEKGPAQTARGSPLLHVLLQCLLPKREHPHAGSRRACATNLTFNKETVCCEVAGRGSDQELVLWASY